MKTNQHRTASEVIKARPTTPRALYDGQRRLLTYQSAVALREHAAVAAVLNPVQHNNEKAPASVNYTADGMAYALNQSIVVAVRSAALPPGEYTPAGKLIDDKPFRLDDLRELIRPEHQRFRLDKYKTPLSPPARMAKECALPDKNQRCPGDRENHPIGLQIGDEKLTITMSSYAVLAWAIYATADPYARPNPNSGVLVGKVGDKYPTLQFATDDVLVIMMAGKYGEWRTNQEPEKPKTRLVFLPVNATPWKRPRKPALPNGAERGEQYAARAKSRPAELAEIAAAIAAAEQRRQDAERERREYEERRNAREEEIRREKARKAADERKVLIRWSRRTGKPIPHKGRNWCEWRDALQAQEDFESNPTQGKVITAKPTPEVSDAAVRASQAAFYRRPNKWGMEYAKFRRNESARRQIGLPLAA